MVNKETSFPFFQVLKVIGLLSLSVRRRTKEIAIRKVIGARVTALDGFLFGGGANPRNLDGADVNFVRGDIKFATLDELIVQLGKDKDDVLALLAAFD